MINSTTKKKNHFILDTQLFFGKVILVKGRNRPSYLLSKNSQLRLWHRRLEYASNTRVMEVSKLTNRINIIINKDQQEKHFFSDSKNNVKDENSDVNPASNTNLAVYANINKDFYITNQVKFTMLNKVISISSIDSNNLIKQLCNLCIENKYTKVIKYIKMNLTI